MRLKSACGYLSLSCSISPPGGGSAGDVVTPAFRHPRASYRWRVRWTRRQGHRKGMPTIAMTLASNQSNLQSITGVLHNDKAGLAVAVETVGSCQELARDTTLDPELAIHGEFERHRTGRYFEDRTCRGVNLDLVDSDNVALECVPMSLVYLRPWTSTEISGAQWTWPMFRCTILPHWLMASL